MVTVCRPEDGLAGEPAKRFLLEGSPLANPGPPAGPSSSPDNRAGSGVVFDLMASRGELVGGRAAAMLADASGGMLRACELGSLDRIWSWSGVGVGPMMPC